MLLFAAPGQPSHRSHKLRLEFHLLCQFKATIKCNHLFFTLMSMMLLHPHIHILIVFNHLLYEVKCFVSVCLHHVC